MVSANAVQKYYGGNPSGHITQASFALTVYGKDHGSAWLTGTTQFIQKFNTITFVNYKRSL